MNNNLKAKEKELEKELNKSKLHYISIDHSPSEEKIRVARQAEKKSKNVLKQIAKMFKKLDQNSDDSGVLSSIKGGYSSKKS